ncbi:MAG: GPW/gp25 family protein [Phaeodactylibacter sp.]|nr:GPW/gp25 family protein [Phaeodactylibacter sp.]MCB9286257.1 GPW/gp25 family protein [Lewinellaceae bacterium]
MDINFPYGVGQNGRTATTDYSEHVRDMIRQVLFTSPGERVNRPTFGSGLNQLVFEPNSPELAATIQFLVKGALQEWLSDVIEVIDLQATAEDSTLKVQLTYREIATQSTQEALFQRSF